MPAPRARAVVIGGGIGGLTAALALHRTRWEVTVLERAPSLEPVGAGIGLAPNGQRALDTVGLGDEIRELAAWQGDGGLRTPDGRWLSRIGSAAVAARFGGPVVIAHRAELVARLLARIPGGTVRTGVTARLLDPGKAQGAPARVAADGEEIEADLVVGADGIHSGVRRALFPGHPGPRYSGLTTWRVVVPGLGRPFPPHESWGRAMLWGTLPLQDGRIYAYAAAPAPAGERAPDEHAELLRRFGNWHDPIPAILGSLTHDQVLRHDVHHLIDPLPAFHRGRTALLGDAAHAMAPNLGQGGNQAIEDAVVLAHHLGPGPGRGIDRGPALAAYSAERLPRTTAVVRKAARVARLVQLSSRPAVAARDGVLRLAALLGPGAAVRTMDGIADWRPPRRTYADRAPQGRATERGGIG
ncbi:FAD-dependent monooxygenase [Streptomyces sp. NPDC000594]|uniref:FAD-dependent monooxygenase n=1 Tax=Streptomyces sp. NPDC000594 TaxID=3154261 RepID=UPI0033314777